MAQERRTLAVADPFVSRGDAGAREVSYTFKGDPFSSHTAILRLAGVGRGRRLLDVGAADGFLARQLSAQGWRVTAIERDPRLAAGARAHCDEMITWDLNEGAPRVEGSFEAIVYGDVLEHLVDPIGVFRTLNQALSRDGIIIVSVPNVAHLWVRLNLLMGYFDYAERGILDRTHLRFFTLTAFRSFLEEAGVHIVTLESVPAPLMLVVPKRFHGAWLRGLHGLNAMSARMWPRGLGYQFVVLGRKVE